MLRLIIATALAIACTAAARPQEAPLAVEPSYRQYVPGLLTRQVYTTRDQVTVDIWDLMVGPGKASAPANLPGAAVLEVRSGTGTLEHAGERRTLKLGSVLTLPAQTEFRLTNASATQSLVLRAIIVTPRTP